MNICRNRRCSDRKKKIEKIMVSVIFNSRWLQAPLYLGLIIAQCVYVYHFIVELLHLLGDLTHVSENQIMLIVLGLIDVVMISNLLVMVIVGGYETFVSRLEIRGHPDAPDWLSHVNVNTMKIKLGLALIGISSIHLLKTFIDIDQYANNPDHGQFVVISQLALHAMFLISAMAVAFTAKISESIAGHDIDEHHEEHKKPAHTIIA
ncbi:MAG: TIGR00645 family protein [Alphaproteobacteria bacterium]|nr:TIGR00645 family protein [Alphaproteobacteria bacterium]